jgi:hypothetical protein
MTYNLTSMTYGTLIIEDLSYMYSSSGIRTRESSVLAAWLGSKEHILVLHSVWMRLLMISF